MIHRGPAKPEPRLHDAPSWQSSPELPGLKHHGHVSEQPGGQARSGEPAAPHAKAVGSPVYDISYLEAWSQEDVALAASLGARISSHSWQQSVAVPEAEIAALAV